MVFNIDQVIPLMISVSRSDDLTDAYPAKKSAKVIGVEIAAVLRRRSKGPIFFETSYTKQYESLFKTGTA
jgi:hypothetical protein